MTEELSTVKRRESPNAEQPDSRRQLIKRIVLLSATGYLAPKAILISEAWACHQVCQHSKPPPGQSVCP